MANIKVLYVGGRPVGSKSGGRIQVFSSEGSPAPVSFPINVTISNGEYSGPSSILPGGTAVITVTPNTGYELRADGVTVSGASYTLNGNQITLSNPTGSVSVGITCALPVYYGGLTFTASVDTTLGMNAVGTVTYTPTLEYSKDAITWTTFTPGETEISLSAGERACFRGNNTCINNSYSNYWHFQSEDSVACSGNIMSILDTTMASTTISTASCFAYLFSKMDITTAPSLPAVTLSNYCYYNMFFECTKLVTPPIISAINLAYYCCQSMFEECTSLTSAPSLPASTLATGCYSYMFSGCTSLTSPPSLTAMSLGMECYQYMFRGCTALTTAPELPATALAQGCYNGMFQRCTGLVTAPALLATTLVKNCYNNMFYGCTSLNEIAIAYTGNFSTTYCNQWVYNVAASGSFYYYGSDTTRGTSAIPTGWTVYAPDYLCFTAVEPGTIKMEKSGSPTETPSLWYSTNRFNWKAFTPGTYGTTISLDNMGDKVYFRGTNIYINNSTSSYWKYFMSGKISASGTIMSLLDPTAQLTTISNMACFSGLFNGCSSLTTAPSLTATTLYSNCYQHMFSGCTGLTIAPALPATILKSGCYGYMFNGCTGLTTAPTISATTLAEYCCQSMFSNCTSLTTVPDLPTVQYDAYQCYLFMFNGCTSLVTAPNIGISTMNDGYCCASMFVGCTSLTTPPTLSATTIASGSYSNMFRGCTSLVTAPALPATTIGANCYNSMFKDCTALTAAPTLPATTMQDSCYRSMFEGCTSLTIPAALPSRSLNVYCYNSMYKNCSSLRMSQTQTTEYTTAWRIPTTGTISSVYQGWNDDMLAGTGGTYTSDPLLQRNYYYNPTPPTPTGFTGLCFTANEAGSTVELLQRGTRCTSYDAYSTDGTTWTEFTPSTLGTNTVTLTNVGDKVYFKSTLSGDQSTSNFRQFAMTGSVSASGNVNSMYVAENFESLTTLTYTHCFSKMFYGQFPEIEDEEEAEIYANALQAPPELPATTLSDSCYYTMFCDSWSLSSAPTLPALTLAVECYASMFNGCWSITTAPDLPATDLAAGCYRYMFAACDTLESIKLSYTGSFDESYFEGWVENVPDSGTFYYNGTDTTRGISAIPEGWTVTSF